MNKEIEEYKKNKIKELINKKYLETELESSVQKDILNLLSYMNIENFRVNVVSGKTKTGRYVSSGVDKGFPDLFGYLPNGLIFFVEVKRPDLKGVQSKHQKEFQYKVEANNSTYILATHPKQVYDKVIELSKYKVIS